ncbi:MAG: nucleotidyltransferase family protein, partial [Calditrichaeota bacterium]|nr:nucleotidyltransferase family protein [Calditrichota bacterium]
LCGWRSIPQAKEILARRPTGKIADLAFCGIHVISPRLLTKLTEQGAFSIVDSYLRLAGQDEKITAFRADEFRWRDVGKLSEVT